jgi:hypothetical protein
MPNNVRDDIIEILEAISKAQLNTLRHLRRGGRKEIEPAVAHPAKSMSHVDMVYDILLTARRPVHISEILTLVAKRHGVKLDRESIVSALAKRIARKDRFVRTAPNTFYIMPDEER